MGLYDFLKYSKIVFFNRKNKFEALQNIRVIDVFLNILLFFILGFYIPLYYGFVYGGDALTLVRNYTIIYFGYMTFLFFYAFLLHILLKIFRGKDKYKNIIKFVFGFTQVKLILTLLGAVFLVLGLDIVFFIILGISTLFIFFWEYLISVLYLSKCYELSPLKTYICHMILYLIILSIFFLLTLILNRYLDINFLDYIR